MPDHATSTSPAVQAQLDRLTLLSPGADVLGLDRITTLLARLGDPHRALPPVFHVAGTNGKGSTCAFLRAAIEAAGHDVHVYSSPHLVRFNERIRVAGRLIDDNTLAALLAEVLDVADDVGASFFEVTTAAAFLAFARTPAAACIVEVGLGGRLDATNVIEAPAVCGIAALGMDHEAFLGTDLTVIAAEKAGIAKPGAPLVTMDYPAALQDRIVAVAAAAGAPLMMRGRDWHSDLANDELRYEQPGVALVTPGPRLVGAHQAHNLALAIAMLRHQQAVAVPDGAIRDAARTATWPARMQRLGSGPLADRLRGGELWLDGAHNPSAALPVARALAAVASGRPVALVIGLLANKDATGVLAALAPAVAHVVAVPVDGHPHHAPEALAATAEALGLSAGSAPTLSAALSQIADRDEGEVVLIAGSLYLAGQALASNDEPPS
jgi:dihydrofolate synthase/folylpolyglutamate synthase